MKGTFSDFWLTRQQLEEASHGDNAVDHALIHTDIENIGAIFDLLAGYADRGLVLALFDQFPNFGEPATFVRSPITI